MPALLALLDQAPPSGRIRAGQFAADSTEAVAPWPDVHAGNAERLEERRNATDRALTEEFLSMRHETLLLFSQLTPKHLDLRIMFVWEPSPNERTILEYLLFFERHDRTHRDQLRPAMRWVRAYGGR